MEEPKPPTFRLDGSAPEAPPVPLKLQVVSGPNFGRELRLELGTYRVGSASGNDLQLDDPAISRTHLVLAVLERGVRITDNGSTNGSSCRGLRFTSLEAGEGAVLRIGQTELRLAPLTEPPPSLRPSEQERFGRLLGKSLAMRQVFSVLERVSATDAPVLIQGETGTGKDLCARSLHQASPRAKGPFVVCDLAAVSVSLFESELFGHVKGAFTTALTDRPGVFEQAHGGTLLLDEVGELPLELQPRLLRALDAGEVKRIGDSALRALDVRVLAATHRDLAQEVARNRFREDLFHRLSTLQVTLPPLRDRPEDIPLLVDHLLQELGHPMNELSPQTRALLCDYAWPGNVRELRNVVSRIVHLGESAVPNASGRPGRGADWEASLPFKEAKDRVVAAFEQDYLRELLASCDGNMSKAARKAGVDRVHLWRLVKKHRLEGDGS